MTELKNIEPDYVHSSNALFSFMKEASYLEDALLNKRLCPRYCGEKIEYLNLLEPLQGNLYFHIYYALFHRFQHPVTRETHFRI